MVTTVTIRRGRVANLDEDADDDRPAEHDEHAGPVGPTAPDDEQQTSERRERAHRCHGEVDDARSAVDEDEAERDQPVERPDDRPVDEVAACDAVPVRDPEQVAGVSAAEERLGEHDDAQCGEQRPTDGPEHDHTPAGSDGSPRVHSPRR
jgi:hypothetical protein